MNEEKEILEKPEYFYNLWMDDVGTISLKSLTTICEELEKLNIKLSNEQENKIFDSIWKNLEELSNGDYKGHN